MLIRTIQKFVSLFLLLTVASVIAALVSRLVILVSSFQYIYPISGVPEAPTAIVYGAGLQRDGTPTPVLRDRVATAAELLTSGKVEKLLMSGDNRFDHYNEPEAMKNYAMSLGVPESAIVLDPAGQRTYDTCFRAKAIYGVRQAILVTQGFHLPRALYTCQMLGIKAVGVKADRREYRKSSLFFWNIRELLATITALWDVNIRHPNPKLGDQDPVHSTYSE